MLAPGCEGIDEPLQVDRSTGEKVLETHFILPAIAGPSKAVFSHHLRKGAFDGWTMLHVLLEGFGLRLLSSGRDLLVVGTDL